MFCIVVAELRQWRQFGNFRTSAGYLPVLPKPKSASKEEDRCDQPAANAGPDQAGPGTRYLAFEVAVCGGQLLLGLGQPQ